MRGSRRQGRHRHRWQFRDRSGHHHSARRGRGRRGHQLRRLPRRCAKSDQGRHRRGKDACVCAMRDAGCPPDVGRRRRVAGRPGRAACSRKCIAEYGRSTSSSTTPASSSPPTPMNFRSTASTRSWPSTCGVRSCAPAQALRHLVQEDRPGAIVNVSSVHQEIPKPRYLPLLREQGRHAEPHPHPRARIRRPGHPGQRHCPRRDDHPDQPVVGGRSREAGHGRRCTSPWNGPASRGRCRRGLVLLSDEAAYITGQTLFVDGGLDLFADFRTTWSSE